MGFTSLDDLLSEITAGKYLRRDVSKITPIVGTAGGWHFLAGANGYPNATTYPSTVDLVWQNCSELIGEGTTVLGIQHGGNPSSTTDTKHIANVGATIVAAAGAPWQLKLVDLQGYYRMSGANVTGTSDRTCLNSTTFTADNSGGMRLTYPAGTDWTSYTKVRFTTTGTLPTNLSIDTDYWLVRLTATTANVATSYRNALAGTYVTYADTGSGTHTMRIQMPRAENGLGCQAFYVVQTAPLTGGPTLSASNYDNTTQYSGSGGRAFQGSPTFGAAADAYRTRIPHSGNAAGRYGPFLPLQGGDLGVARVNSFTWSGGTAYTGTGVMALCIVKPILDITIPISGMWSERDLVNQLPSLPKIEDGACLMWMMFGTGATTTTSPINAAIDFVWG